MASVKIDLLRVDVVLATWDRDALHSLALDLIAALPKTRQAAVLERHVALDEIRVRPARAGNVLAEIQRFHEEALSKEFFETFRVDSKNYMDMSAGTRRFNAEYGRLAEHVAKLASGGADVEACEGFSLLLDLHRRVDDTEDIIFLADEHGAWQIGCDWDSLLPSWFASLARVSDAEAYLEAVLEVIAVLEPRAPAAIQKMALDSATPEQKRELREAFSD